MTLLRNPEAEAFFLARSARDEVGTALMDALKPLGEYELRGDLRVYHSPYAITRESVFCGAAGTSDTFWRLGPKDLPIAFASGAEPAPALGPDWARIELYRPGWPRPDMAHWALRAYVYAREGAQAVAAITPPAGPYDAVQTCVHLDTDGSGQTYEVTPQFWEKLGSGALSRLGHGHLVTCSDFAGDWPTWEMHPAGEEFVMLVSGHVEFELSSDGGHERAMLDTPGQFVLVPRGTWHTANVRKPSRMLFVTRGEGTQHKPRDERDPRG